MTDPATTPSDQVDGSMLTAEQAEAVAHQPAQEEQEERVPAALAIRIALILGGALSLLGTVIFIRDPAIGFTATAASTVAMAGGLLTSGTWPYRRSMPHVMAAVLALVSFFGLCASSCGTYSYYESFLGMPTALAGAIAHLVIATVIWIERHREADHGWGDLASAFGIGSSLFYGTILVAHGTWCGACIAVHCLMAIQLIELLAARRGLRRALPLVAAFAAAFGVNAVYHHRLVPEVRDDNADLLAYLRSQRVSDVPIQPARQMTWEKRSEELTRLSANLEAARRVGDALEQGQPVPATPSRLAQPPPQMPKATRPASGERDPAMANRWGSPQAPVALLALLDTGCPACRGQYGQLLELRDLVEHGVVQVRFLLTYRTEVGQAAATVGYAAGIQGEEPLLDVLRAFYQDQPRMLTPADVLAACPPSFPQKRAIEVVTQHQQNLTNLLADAVRLRDRLGTKIEPTLWFFRQADGDRPARVLTGLTPADALRVTISSLTPSPAAGAP